MTTSDPWAEETNSLDFLRRKALEYVRLNWPGGKEERQRQAAEKLVKEYAEDLLAKIDARKLQSPD